MLPEIRIVASVCNAVRDFFFVRTPHFELKIINLPLGSLTSIYSTLQELAQTLLPKMSLIFSNFFLANVTVCRSLPTVSWH